DDEETLREKNFYLKDRFKRLKGVRFQFHDTKASVVEMLLAKGDRRTLRAVTAAVRLGCRFDSWREHFNYERWMEAFASAGLPVSREDYTEPDAPLPWDIVDTGVPRAFLLREYADARKVGESEAGNG
ncbi:MAG: B12-binding domain-containing radical SAM protein, partial [Clostridiales Family XIII bacterium]|nr:B12-binding domain-containing radical SAM protein [Clostridiales Family XIII bacterium]